MVPIQANKEIKKVVSLSPPTSALSYSHSTMTEKMEKYLFYWLKIRSTTIFQ